MSNTNIDTAISEWANRISVLSYDIRMCLVTGFPVNIMNDIELASLVDGDTENALEISSEFSQLLDYVSSTRDDRAWNTYNVLLGNASA